MLVDIDGFWYRMFSARYGEEAGRLEVGGRSGSYWWREVARIKDGVGEDGESWFNGRVSRKVGDGAATMFWRDWWLGEVPLCRRFGRLFELAENKLITVASMFSLGWGEGEAWQLRRRLWAWEEELLAECRLLLANVTLQINVSDIWQWHPDIVGGYSVRSGYQTLSAQVTPLLDESEKLIWHSQVPSKVSILAWRLFRDRLPTKFNLLNRDIIQVDDTPCMASCGLIESVQHLFITCDFFGSLWQLVRLWLGFSGVDHNVLSIHFTQFTNNLGTRRRSRSFLQLLWLLCVWLI